MKNCKFCSCRFKDVCGNASWVCIIAQYVAIVGVLVWAGYLFLHTA